MKDVIVGKWDKYKNYKCPYCPFATLAGEETVRVHMVNVHADAIRMEAIAEMQAADAAKSAASAGDGRKPSKELQPIKADKGKE